VNTIHIPHKSDNVYIVYLSRTCVSQSDKTGQVFLIINIYIPKIWTIIISVKWPTSHRRMLMELIMDCYKSFNV